MKRPALQSNVKISMIGCKHEIISITTKSMGFLIDEVKKLKNKKS